MRLGVFEPNDSDRRNNSALFGGTVSDSCDALVFSDFLYATDTIAERTGPRLFLVLIAVVIPFVMLIYFGLAFIISDTISIGAVWPTTMEEELSFSEGLVVIVTYVALSGWLWLRWHPKTPDK